MYCGLTVRNVTAYPCIYTNMTIATSSSGGVSLDRMVEYYLISAMCVVGLFGNSLTLLVLWRDKERREALLLQQALAVADGLYLLGAILRYPLKYLLPEYRTYILMQPVVFPLLKTFQTITIWTLVLVTIERYIYVCKPLHAPVLFDRRARRLAAAGVLIAGILYNLPRFFESCVMEWFDPCTNTTYSRSVTRPRFNHALYYDIYKQGAYIVLLYVLPLLILSLMNARLIKAVHRSKRLQRQFTSRRSDSSGSNTTLVLVIIIIVFLVCETPELFLRLATVIERKVESVQFTSDFSLGLEKLTTVSQLLLVINSSTNFFIYLLCARRFRNVMKSTFTRSPTIVSNVTNDSIPLQHNPTDQTRTNLSLKKQAKGQQFAQPLNNKQYRFLVNGQQS